MKSFSFSSFNFSFFFLSKMFKLTQPYFVRSSYKTIIAIKDIPICILIGVLYFWDFTLFITLGCVHPLFVDSVRYLSEMYNEITRDLSIYIYEYIVNVLIELIISKKKLDKIKTSSKAAISIDWLRDMNKPRELESFVIAIYFFFFFFWYVAYVHYHRY